MNNQTTNLKRIDYNCKDYWKEGQGKGHINYQTEQQDIINALQKDPTLGNRDLAKQIFGGKYIAQQHDQFIYRERKKLEDLNLIPISKTKQANEKIGEATQEIINLIKEKKLSGKEIAEKFGVSENTVSRIKKRREQQQQSNESESFPSHPS